MLVVFARFAPPVAATKESHMPGGIHAPMSDELTEICHQTGDIKAVHFGIRRQILNLFAELWSEPLVSVEMQLPGVFEMEGCYRPVPLRAVVLKCMLCDFCSKLFRYLNGAIF